MDALPHFRYKVLNDATRQFRLLRYLCTDDNGLHSYQLDLFTVYGAIPEFVAISYTWGLSQQTAFIIVNNSPFQIRKTALELLVAVQRLNSNSLSLPNYLWIDSICINQGNLRERSMQVQLMRNIYSSAKTVLVWLAAPTPGSDIAMQRLAELAHQDLRYCRPTRARSDQNLQASQSLSATLYGPNSEGIGHTYHGDPDVLRTVLSALVGDALLTQFRRRYWHRMWVIQEVLMAKDVRLVCGSKNVEWNKLNSFFAGLEYQRLASGSQFHGSTRVSQIMNTRAYRFVRERSHLEANPHFRARGAAVSDLVQSFGSFECADKHDKIYGILGLSRDRFDVNYSKSLYQLHNEVLQCVVRTAQMDTIAKAETFSKFLAATLGISTANRQLIKASNLFYCPPVALRWTDPRPFWETDLAQALPQTYMHHITSMVSLSMTPTRISRHDLLTQSTAMGPNVQEGIGDGATVSAPISSVTPSEGTDIAVTDWGSTSVDLGPGSNLGLDDFMSDHVPLSTPDHSVIDYDIPLASADDTNIGTEITHHVDYLDHAWKLEDLQATWKHVRSEKSLRQQGRLENALWRTWNKDSLNPPLVSPETLNWLKDADVTWLYGPFVSKRKAVDSGSLIPSQPSMAKNIAKWTDSMQASSPIERVTRFNDAVHIIDYDESSTIAT